MVAALHVARDAAALWLRSSTSRRTSALRSRAGQAENAVGDRAKADWRDRPATGVARPVGAVVEFGDRPLRAVKPAFQQFTDTDLRQPVDRLGGSVTDSLAEPLGASELGALRKTPPHARAHGRVAPRAPRRIAARSRSSADEDTWPSLVSDVTSFPDPDWRRRAGANGRW